MFPVRTKRKRNSGQATLRLCGYSDFFRLPVCFFFFPFLAGFGFFAGFFAPGFLLPDFVFLLKGSASPGAPVVGNYDS